MAIQEQPHRQAAAQGRGHCRGQFSGCAPKNRQRKQRNKPINKKTEIKREEKEKTGSILATPTKFRS